MNDIETIQVVGSEKMWQGLKTIKMPLWLRLVFFMAGLLSFPLLFFAWIFGKILVFFDLLTGFWIYPFHRFCHKYRHRVRWAFVLSMGALFCGPHPKFAVALMMTYCYLYSYDAPEKWIHWILKISKL